MTCLGIWSSKGCHASAFWGSASPKGPRRSSRLDLPRDSIFRRLSRLSLPRDLHPDPGTPGSQVATVLGKISFKKPVSCFFFFFFLFLFLPNMTVFQMGNNQSTSRQTPLRCILDNWKLFDPLNSEEESFKIILCHCVATISTGGRGTLARGWDFELQYHPATRIILQKTREMDRDPLCPSFLQTER